MLRQEIYGVSGEKRQNVDVQVYFQNQSVNRTEFSINQ